MKFLKNILALIALTTIAHASFAQSSYTDLQSAESPNDPDMPTMSLFAMNSFDIYSFIFARSDSVRDIERFIKPSSPTIEDPWQRREAERDFRERFDERIRHLRDIGPRQDEIIIFEYPLIFTHFDFAQQTFRFEVPAAASAPAYLEGEPFALQPEPVIHISWKWHNTNIGLFGNYCSPSSDSNIERIPTNFSSAQLMRQNAPNRSGFGVSLRELPRSKYTCMELKIENMQLARRIYSYVKENPLFLYGSCLGVVPTDRIFEARMPDFLARRPLGADAVCIIGRTTIGRPSDVQFSTIHHFAVWDEGEGRWSANRNLEEAFADVP